MTFEPDDKHFLAATKEFERGEIDEARWARLLVSNIGDETKAKYQYIAERARKLAEVERETEARSAQVSRDRRKLLARLQAAKGDDPTIVQALSELNIYAERANDGLWRVYLPDGSVWTGRTDLAFHDYAQDILEHSLR